MTLNLAPIRLVPRASYPCAIRSREGQSFHVRSSRIENAANAHGELLESEELASQEDAGFEPTVVNDRVSRMASRVQHWKVRSLLLRGVGKDRPFVPGRSRR